MTQIHCGRRHARNEAFPLACGACCVFCWWLVPGKIQGKKETSLLRAVLLSLHEVFSQTLQVLKLQVSLSVCRHVAGFVAPFFKRKCAIAIPWELKTVSGGFLLLRFRKNFLFRIHRLDISHEHVLYLLHFHCGPLSATSALESCYKSDTR